MEIYIASSWKNQHAVEMLTTLLREKGHQVISWVENNYGEDHNHVTKKFDFETWVNSPESEQSFIFDTEGAANCDVFIYLGPSGKDAAAECGIAYNNKLHCGTPYMIGLAAKGEDFGLMRKMFDLWVDRYTEVLDVIDRYQKPQEHLKEGQTVVNDDLYYIRTEGYLGNSLLWWRSNSQGYTSDLNKAGKYTLDDAKQICQGSKTEVAYQCSKVDNHPKAIFRTVHADHLHYSHADINYRPKQK